MKKLGLAFGLSLLPLSTPASPAIRLIVSNNPCIAEPCPTVPAPPTTIAAGTPFRIYVAAVDSGNGTDATFTGTISFASTDPLASLPPNFTFMPVNEGATRGGLITVLRTPGNQTITVTETLGRVSPGSFTITVTGLVALEPIPEMSAWVRIAFALGLALVGFWLARPRS